MEGFSMITRRKIKDLYKYYLEIVRLEVDECGVKPTEVRHLIGRLGEFYCALKVKGVLAHNANQHGFDVLCKGSGRTISVKTTAQKTGFVAISATTTHKAQDLMIVQYADGELTTVYYGSMKQAIQSARHYKNPGKYELDIGKARRINPS
jgi:hypothetical protein